MEFYFTAWYPSPPSPLSEKLVRAMPKSPMEALLSKTLSYSPEAWLRLVKKNDPDHNYVVTAVSHYKERTPWPAFKDEYIILLVQPRPLLDQPKPTTAPIVIKASRSITSHALPARLGLLGPGDNMVTVLGDATNVQLPDKCLCHLTWPPDQAPHLTRITIFIYDVDCYMSEYMGYLLKTSCYLFARAIRESIYIRLNGIEGVPHWQPKSLRIPQYYLSHIPARHMSARVHSVANAAVVTDQIVCILHDWE
ncbi:hypothetical protein OG21DRAFT_1606987 [Imleria badia]|nr:hypothetical protein OG21DRAFT_1606987 [Imleria badia]